MGWRMREHWKALRWNNRVASSCFHYEFPLKIGFRNANFCFLGTPKFGNTRQNESSCAIFKRESDLWTTLCLTFRNCHRQRIDIRFYLQFVDHCCNAWRLHCDKKKRRKSSSSSAAIILRLRMNINRLLRKLLRLSLTIYLHATMYVNVCNRFAK